MCNISNDTAQLVDEVVTTWTQQQRMFTTYEVTLEVQATLKQKQLPFVRHQEMRSYYDESQPLQDALQSSYDATLRPMDHGDYARVYHPRGTDPSQYQPLNRQKGAHQPPQVPSSNGVATTVNQISLGNGQPHSTPNGKSHDPNVAEVNKSGELWVGSPLVRQAGFHPGDVVDVDVVNGVVTFQTISNNSGLKQKMVETYGNLRLYTKDRTVFGLAGTRFKVEAETGKVTVTPI